MLLKRNVKPEVLVSFVGKPYSDSESDVARSLIRRVSTVQFFFQSCTTSVRDFDKLPLV